MRPRRIVEGHILERNRPFGTGRDQLGLSRVLHLVLGIQKLHQPLSGPRCPLQLRPDLGQGAHRARHHDRIDHKLHQRTDRHAASGHIMHPDPQDPHHAREDQRDHDHRHDGPRRDTDPRAVETFFGQVGKLTAAQILMGKGLHGLHRQKRFRRIA